MGQCLIGTCVVPLRGPCLPALELSRGRPHAWPWRYTRRQPNDTAPARELAEGGALVVAGGGFDHRSPTMPHGINHRFEA